MANALHSLKLDSRLLPQIVRIMSKDLAALIILESRFRSWLAHVQSVRKRHSRGGAEQPMLAPLTRLVETWAYPAPKIPAYTRKIRSQYLLSCALSLPYWNRFPYLYSYVCLYYFYGVCGILESPFAKKDSACGLESGLSAQGE